MSEKFDMKLVIDPVTTPLLHARLTAASSARERAALLRSLAESALREADDHRTSGVRFVPAPHADTRWLSDHSTVPDHVPSPPSTRSLSADYAAPGRSAISNEEAIESYDPDAIGEQFASFY